MVVPHKCCYCSKSFTTLYAMVDGWACEKDWELHEDRSYVQSVREAEGELRDYKKAQRFKEYLISTQSPRL